MVASLYTSDFEVLVICAALGFPLDYICFCKTKGNIGCFLYLCFILKAKYSVNVYNSLNGYDKPV